MAKKPNQLTGDERALQFVEGTVAGDGGNVELARAYAADPEGTEDLIKGKKPKKDEDDEPEGDEPEQEPEGSDEAGGDEDEEEAGKSEPPAVSSETLGEALSLLEATAKSVAAGTTGRLGELADKLSKGELTAEERVEMQGLLGSSEGAAVEDEPFQRSMLTDDAGKQYLEMSQFLEWFVTKSASGMDAMRSEVLGAIQEQRQAAGTFNVALAKSLRAMATENGELRDLVKGQQVVIEALDQRLHLVERTPQLAKGMTSPPTRRRTFAGGSNGDNTFAKTDVFKAFDRMLAKGETSTRSGHEIPEITALIESQGGDRVQLEANLAADIRAEIAA